MIYGPVYRTISAPIEMIIWLDQNLTQGIDYNWELESGSPWWSLFFYNNPENITAFKLKFGV